MNTNLSALPVGAIVVERTFEPVTREDLRRYAAASGDLNPLHLDPAFARQAGFDDVIVHGMLGMAILGRLVTECLSGQRLLAFRARFRNVIQTGEPLHCRARLDSRTDDTIVLGLEALASTGVLLIDGTARIAWLTGV
jgi:acyl dehydratase